MGKLILFIIFLLISPQVHADTTLLYSNSLPTKDNCSGEYDANGVYKYGIPSTNLGISPVSGSINCKTRYYYSYEDYTKTYVDYNGNVSSITACNSGDRVININTSNHTITCRKGYDEQKKIEEVSSDLNSLGTTNTRLKVSGLVGTNSNADGITSNQTANIKVISGDFDKALLKSIIKSSSISLVNSIMQDSTDSLNNSKIIDLNDLNSPYNKGGILVGSDKNIRVFKTNKVVTFGDESYDGTKTIAVSGIKTIVIYGGDLYINRNMYYTNKANSILGIVVLKDKNGKGGNIYINPNVTNIVGSIFAEKTIMSASVTNYSSSPQGITYYSGSDDIFSLRNQLYLYGNLFSENTIGGSTQTPYECPFFVSNCTLSEATKYDLNFIRSYFLYEEDKNYTLGSGKVIIPYNNGKVIGGGSCSVVDGKCTNFVTNLDKFIVNNSTLNFNTYNAGYSFIINYNPLLQTSPPPLFSAN